MDAILFDLDNTLYAPERQLFGLIDRRINRYMCEVVGIPSAEVDGLRRRYWDDYGVTLQGLIRHHDVDPEDYLDYVHDVDIPSRIVADPRLRTMLAGLQQRRVVFTNGCRHYARRVLSALEVEDLFEQIYDIRVATYLPKPKPQPYLAVLEQLGLAGQRCVMVEDTAANLETAKRLGMKTVLVSPQKHPPSPWIDRKVDDVSEVGAVLAAWKEE